MCNQTIKVGDKVKVTQRLLNNGTGCDELEWVCLTVSEIDPKSHWPITVLFNNKRWALKYNEVELVNDNLTKEEWLKGMLDGKIGRQSLNKGQKWFWDGETFCSEYAGSVIRNADLSSLRMKHGRKLWLEEPCTEMTIKEIEEKLGVTNLKIVKE